MRASLGAIDLEELAHCYLDAKAAVVGAGYEDEIRDAEEVTSEVMTEEDLLQEGAWVIFNSGMRERVIRRCFPEIRSAYHGFVSADRICDDAVGCRARALQVFNHRGKVDAVIALAGMVASCGYERFMSELMAAGPAYLEALPYFGPATSLHLAKNLGLDVAKPDRHLRRLAETTGFASPQALCEALSEVTGDRIGVIDGVLWRFAAEFPSLAPTFGVRSDPM